MIEDHKDFDALKRENEEQRALIEKLRAGAASRQAGWALCLIDETRAASENGSLPGKPDDCGLLGDIAANIPGVTYRFLQKPDGTGSFPYISPAAENFLGSPLPHPLEPEAVFRLIHPDDLPFYHKAATKAAERMEPWIREFRIMRPDGGIRRVLCASAPRRLSDGSVLWDGLMLDVTGRKLAENARHENGERYLSLLESLPRVAVQAYSTDGTVTYWNKASERLYGYTAGEAIGSNVFDLVIPPEMTEEVKMAIREMAETEKPVPASELYLRRKDGSLACVFSSHAVVRTPGNGLELFRIDVDLSAQKSAEEKLKESEERLRLLVKNSSDILVVINGDGIQRYVSQAAERITGFQATELAGKSLDEVIHPDDIEIIASAFMDAMNHPERTISVQYRHIHKTTGWVHLEAVGQVLLDEPAVNGIIVSVRDISARKIAEEALRESEERARAKLRAILSPDGDIGLLELADVMDLKVIQSLMNDLNKLTGLAAAIVDKEGKLLAAAGLQDICMKFHRAHPATAENCAESNAVHSKGVEQGSYKLYKCKNNMLDVSTPVILGGKHVANLFLGQFFFDDEEPDIEVFRAQAKKYGFDEKAYLEALGRVPRLKRETMDVAMSFYAGCASLISELYFGNLKLARTLSERRSLFDSLKRSEGLLNAAQSLIKAGGWEYSPKDDRIFWSDEAYRIHGLDRRDQPMDADEYISRSIECYDPADRQRITDALRRCVELGEPYDIEARFTSHRGEKLWVRTVARAERSDGETVKVIGILADITEDKRKEERIAVLGKMLDLAPASISIHDLSGKFLYTNKITTSMHGYVSDGEYLAQNLHDLDDPESVALYDERVKLVMEEGEARFEVGHFRKDGSILPMEVIAKSIEWDGEPAIMSVATDITDRKNAEDIIRKSEEWYRDLVHILSKVIWTYEMETDGSIGATYGAPLAEELLGLPEGALKNDYSEFFAYIHPEDLESVFNSLIDILNNPGAIGTVEYRLIKPGGEIMWVESHGSSHRKPDGKTVCFGTSLDITEKKKAEQDRSESESKYRLLADNTVDTIWLMDLNLDFLYINPAVFPVTGYTVDEWVGSNLRDHCDEENFQKMVTVVMNSLTTLPGNTGTVFEAVMLKKNKEPFNVEINGLVLLDASGNPVGLQGVTRDITERKKAEKALKESEKRHSDYIRETPYGVFVTDETGRYIEVNPAACRITGYSEEELLTMSTTDISAGDMDAAKRHFVTLVSEGRSHGSLCYRHKSGETRWWSVSAVRLSDTRFLGFCNDITDQVNAEAEKAKLEDRIRQAQKMESVGRLAGGIAHDFNNMLGVILGHTELALEHVPRGDQLYQALEEISQAAGRSAALTRQLLAFARKQTVAPKVLDVNDTVGGMLKMLSRLMGEDIDLAWLPGKNVGKIFMDPAQIDQILANLCINARDAVSAHGKVTIETGNIVIGENFSSAPMGWAPGEYVMLAVTDTGTGMDKETVANIFEPFFTTKEMGKGTGLGLATVYGIVSQNKGFINVYSEPGQGTTFKIYLPFHHGEAQQRQTEKEEKQPLRGAETVLMVEDEPAILKVVSAMLKKQGYHVLTAGSPKEAFNLAEKHKGEIHLLVTDVVMPHMNGKDLAIALREIHPRMKCLFMSGYTANVIAHHGVLDQNVNFIEKPFSIKDFARKVREAIDGK